MNGLGLGHLSLPEFITKIRDDPKFYYDSPEEVLAGFRDIVDNKIGPNITKIFTHQPKHKLVYGRCFIIQHCFTTM